MLFPGDKMVSGQTKQHRVPPPTPMKRFSCVPSLPVPEFERRVPVVRDVGKNSLMALGDQIDSVIRNCQTFQGQLFGKNKLSGCVKLAVIPILLFST